jgi:integrase
MEQKRLTPQLINSLKGDPKGEYSVQDSIEPSLTVRVRQSGKKSFQVRYRPKGRRGQPKRYTIGNTEALSLSEARQEAERIRALVTLNQDPAAEKSAKLKEMTIGELCDLYLEEGTATKKASTLATDKGRIERHIKPLLRKKLVTEITSADIEKFMRDVAAGKTATDLKTGSRGRAIVEGGKGTATRTVGLLGGILSFAQRRKLRSDNPVRGVKRYADKKNERFLSEVELQRLGEAISEYETEGGNSSAIAILRLLALTGARKTEISALQWNEVDLERGCLKLADSKTGAKILPIGRPAALILETLLDRKNSKFVFPAEAGDRHFQGTEKVWVKIREKAGLKDVRLHDLRHSFASVAIAKGNALPIIGKLLGHADTKTTSRYAHLADDPVKQAADQISTAISNALTGKKA